jgi:hypothetical protein
VNEGKRVAVRFIAAQIGQLILALLAGVVCLACIDRHVLSPF